MDESNSIRLDYLIQVLPEELHPTITTLSETCGTKGNIFPIRFNFCTLTISLFAEGNDKCNIAYNTLQCYVENNPLMIKQNFEFLFD